MAAFWAARCKRRIGFAQINDVRIAVFPIIEEAKIICNHGRTDLKTLELHLGELQQKENPQH